MSLLMQVRKRPLNKKELAKNEEDIIETYANSLTVHETKLKVSMIICILFQKLNSFQKYEMNQGNNIFH